jgi:hypothetical protein
MKPEDVDTVLEDMPKYVKFVVNQLLHKVNVFGMDLLQFESYNTHSYSSWEYVDLDEYDGEYPQRKSEYSDNIFTVDSPSEAWGMFKKAMKKAGYETYEYEIDM